MNELTKEFLEKDMECETTEELIALAKEEAIELTKEQAEELLAKLSAKDLDMEQLKNIAGGWPKWI